MKKKEETLEEAEQKTMDRLEKLSKEKSTFAPPLLGILKSMNPEMRSFYVNIVSNALAAAETISGAAHDEEFVRYATSKKQNG